jgi:hypothetical protein
MNIVKNTPAIMPAVSSVKASPHLNGLKSAENCRLYSYRSLVKDGLKTFYNSSFVFQTTLSLFRTVQFWLISK